MCSLYVIKGLNDKSTRLYFSLFDAHVANAIDKILPNGENLTQTRISTRFNENLS